jgi:hypothetical protein
MSNAIDQLRRKSNANFSFLQKEIEKSNTTQGSSDERFWKPELDGSGNGFAVIRFLPQPDGEDLPWAKVYSHAFTGPSGQWFIENCLTTKGEKCPVCAHNNALWNSGMESDKDIARKQKRKLSYYANIYVVKDPKNPENEGRVFLYKFGKKIFDKITAAMEPEFQDETPVNVFDFWEGANFKLKIKTVAGYWNYDSSEFDRPAALSEDDSKLEEIYENQYSLEAFTAPSEFKTYDELENRKDVVLGVAPAIRQAQQEEEYEPAPMGGGFNDSDITPKSSFRQRMEGGSSSQPSAPADDDDALSYFARLAEE